MHKATKNTTHLFVNKSDTNKTFECVSWKQTQLLVTILPRKQKQILNCYQLTKTTLQRAKKVVSDSPSLVNLTIGLVNSVLSLPNKFLGEFILHKYSIKN